MFTPEQYRAKAAEYTELAKQGNTPDEVREFHAHEQSLTMLADNKQWLADNDDKLADNSDEVVRRSAMSETDNVRNHALMCMRLVAECRGLAADVPEPDLRAHFLHMAGMWVELALQPRVLH